MRAVDVNHVHPGLETAVRRLNKGFDDDLNVLISHLTRHGARIDERAWHDGGRDRLALTGRDRRLASAVIEFHRELGSVLVDGVGDLAEPRNDGVVVATYLERVPTPFGSHIDRLELNQRYAAFRPLPALMDVTLVKGAIQVCHRLFHGSGDEPVSHLHAVDLAGTKKVFECHSLLRSQLE